MSVQREDLRKAEARLHDLKDRYLKEHGWKLDGRAPGGIILWRKVYLDDTYICNMAMAVCVEEALSPE